MGEEALSTEPALGTTIRLLRERCEGKPTPAQLGDRADVDVAAVKGIEAGEDPPWSTVVLLAGALGVSMREFSELHEDILHGEVKPPGSSSTERR